MNERRIIFRFPAVARDPFILQNVRNDSEPNLLHIKSIGIKPPEPFTAI